MYTPSDNVDGNITPNTKTRNFKQQLELHNIKQITGEEDRKLELEVSFREVQGSGYQ